MKRTLLFLLALGSAFGQTVAGSGSEEYFPEATHIAERIAVSDLVVVGTVEKIEFALTRAYLARIPELEKQAKETGSVPLDQPAEVFVIRVDSALCQQADFVPGAEKKVLPARFYIVNTSGFRTGFHLGYRDELLREGTQYLFSLDADPKKDANVAKYDLDADMPQYTVLHHSDGAVQLPSAAERGKPGAFKPFGYQSERDLATPVLNVTSAICEAVQPANALQKADGLERLKSSPDLNMRHNAETALKILRGEPIR